jgi:putative spermidine/putrescine transport system substrate-binding protein
MGQGITRRSAAKILLAAAASPILGTKIAWAQQRPAAPVASKAGALENELVFAGRGGSFGNIFQKSLLPKFEAKFNCKVTMIMSESGPGLAKVVAQRANPQVDVLWTVEPTHARAFALGVIDRLDYSRMANFESLFDFARQPDGAGVGWGVGATVMGINAEIYKKQGIEKPTSWHEIVTQKTRGHVAWLDLSGHQGINTFLISNKVLGGSESNVDPIFKFFKAHLNDITFVTSPAQVDSMLQQKDAWVSTNLDGRFSILKESGFPLEIIYPAEGLPLQSTIMDLVKGAPHPNLAYEFMNWMLSAEVQQVVVNEMKLGPVNKNVKVDAASAQSLIYGPEKVGKLLEFDWGTVTKQMPGWLDRWNRELS